MKADYKPDSPPAQFRISCSRMRLSDLQDGRDIPGDSGNPTDVMPDWMDMDKFRRGRQFLLDHTSSILLGLHFSLASGLSITTLLTPLVFTGQSSTPQTAADRYSMTGYYLILWYAEDVWDAPNGLAYKAIRKVRSMHSSVARAMNRSEKQKDGPLFVSQYDMAVVQAGFMGAALLYTRDLGIRCTRQELEDYAFYWRGIGYLLGIEDRYNMCTDGLDGAYNVCKDIEQELLLPGLRNPPKDFYPMQDAYLRGVDRVMGFRLNTQPAITAMVNRNLGLPLPALSLPDRLRFWLFRLVLAMFWWLPWFEPLFNRLHRRKFNLMKAKQANAGKKD